MTRDTSINRRRFLETVALTGSALASSSTLAQATRPSPALTLGFSTYGAKSLTTEAAIALIKTTGFDSVELTIWPGWDANPATMAPRRRKEIRKRLSDAGLRVTRDDLLIQAGTLARFEEEHGVFRRVNSNPTKSYDWEGFYGALILRLFQRGIDRDVGAVTFICGCQINSRLSNRYASLRPTNKFCGLMGRC